MIYISHGASAFAAKNDVLHVYNNFDTAPPHSLLNQASAAHYFLRWGHMPPEDRYNHVTFEQYILEVNPVNFFSPVPSDGLPVLDAAQKKKDDLREILADLQVHEGFLVFLSILSQMIAAAVAFLLILFEKPKWRTANKWINTCLQRLASVSRKSS